LRERALHLLPVYYLLTLSDLGREAVLGSGSHRFADHIYVGTPSGRTVLGRWLDARLLAMPAARAFRRRCGESQRAMQKVLESCADDLAAVRVLAIPCGIPRDLQELVHTLRGRDSALLDRLEYHGMDIDPEVLAEAGAAIAQCGLTSTYLHEGDALAADEYPPGPFDLVVSTGLGEFLQRDELMTFYSHVHGLLRPGGVFFTSATAKDPSSDRLLQMVELVTQYRSADDLLRVLEGLPWRELRVTRDPSGLQTFVMATR
jgi:SAM-dependent methyltransferase